MNKIKDKHIVYTSLLISVIIVLFLKDLDVYKIINYYLISIHEVMHGFFALLTGGTLHSIDVNSNGGIAKSSGGFFPLISMGGYIGNALIGGLFLYFSNNEKHTDLFIYTYLTLTSLIFLIYVESYLNLFTFIFIFTNIIIFFSTKLKYTKYVSIFLGTIFLFDSISDVKSYFLPFNNQVTDSDILANWLGCSCFSIFIGFFIFIISSLIYIILIKKLIKKL